MKLYINYPYDVGSPHELVGENGEKAVISAEAAGALLSMGIPAAPELGVEPPEILEFGPKISNKVRRMLGMGADVASVVQALYKKGAHGPRRQRKRLDA